MPCDGPSPLRLGDGQGRCVPRRHVIPADVDRMAVEAKRLNGVHQDGKRESHLRRPFHAAHQLPRHRPIAQLCAADEARDLFHFAEGSEQFSFGPTRFQAVLEVGDQLPGDLGFFARPQARATDDTQNRLRHRRW